MLADVLQDATNVKNAVIQDIFHANVQLVAVSF